MNVTGRTKIYRKDYDGRAVYSRSIASKLFENGQQTDKWIRVYEDVRLPKGTELLDGTTINVINGFETVYAAKNGEIKRRLVIQKFEVAEESGGSYQNNAGSQSQYDAESFEGFVMNDEDMPF